MVTVTSTSKQGILDDLVKRISKMQAYVGVTEADSGRKDKAINNAQLVYIHTNGSPARNIPPRPIREPAIEAEDNKNEIARLLEESAKAVLEGDEGTAQQRLEEAGMTGMVAARDWFDDPRNNWAPDKPATIKRKGSDHPLIDTGAMRQAITYIVTDKDNP
jgi:hypothetical protein